MTKLTCRAAFPAINLTVKNDTGTNSLFHENENKIANFPDFRASKPQLRKSGCVRIVVNANRKRGGPGQRFGYWSVAPVKVRHVEIARFGVNHSGHADSDSFNCTSSFPNQSIGAINNLRQGFFHIWVGRKFFLL